MIEVEAKAKIDNFEDVKLELKKINAKKIKTEYQEDLYFNSPITDFSESDEALRIRKTENESENKIFITYKGPKIDKKSKTREEIEIEIDDYEKCKRIFEHIGFNASSIVSKKRDIYKFENYEISLDDVKGLEPYIEIEIVLNDNNDYKKAQEGLFKIFEKLNINSGFERTSYLELLENKNYK